MKILAHKVLYRNERFYAAFPNVVLGAEGSLLLAFRRAPDHRWMLGELADEDFDSVDHWHFRSHIAAIWLNDQLAPIGDVFNLPSHPEAADQDANLFVTNTGRIIQYGFLWYPVTSQSMDRIEEEGLSVDRRVGEGYLYFGGYTRFSDDGGKSWSDHLMIPTDEHTSESPYQASCNSSAFRGRMIECADGSLLMAGYAGRLVGYDKSMVRLYRSCDGGSNWQVAPEVVSMPNVALQEPALARWPQGKVTIFNRTTGNDDRLVIATAGECGENFEKPCTVDIQGHPYDPLVLPDGRLFLVYGYRHEPMGVRARLVGPGQSIDTAEEFIIRADSPSADTGYPSAVYLGDGRILIAYYITDGKGIRGIEGTVVTID